MKMKINWIHRFHISDSLSEWFYLLQNVPVASCVKGLQYVSYFYDICTHRNIMSLTPLFYEKKVCNKDSGVQRGVTLTTSHCVFVVSNRSGSLKPLTKYCTGCLHGTINISQTHFLIFISWTVSQQFISLSHKHPGSFELPKTAFQENKSQNPQCLPVMVSYDCSQSSDTYSVAHQMDFLAQEVFQSARRQQQNQVLYVFYIPIWCPEHFLMIIFLTICLAFKISPYLPFGSSPTREVRKTRRPTPVKARVTLKVKWKNKWRAVLWHHAYYNKY